LENWFFTDHMHSPARTMPGRAGWASNTSPRCARGALPSATRLAPWGLTNPSDTELSDSYPSDNSVKMLCPTACLDLALDRSIRLRNASTRHRETANCQPWERSHQVCPTSPSVKRVGLPSDSSAPSDSIVRHQPSSWRSTGAALALVRTRLTGLGPQTRPIARRQAGMCPGGFPECWVVDEVSV